ncbi:MFS transporter [Allopusillimonas ginsengisoli]|nr:MFS transporter [Allopusillimonas ginsengisoli]
MIFILFGIIAAAGALAAPLAGKLADKRGPPTVITQSIMLTTVAFLIFGVSRASLLGLVLGVIVLDVGLQAAQVSNQARIFSLKPEARSRVNTVYMTFYFICGATGSVTGVYAWQHYEWNGVVIAGVVFTAIAYVNHTFAGLVFQE